MGRPKKVVDTGDPGKYYFHKPIAVHISLPGKEKEVQQSKEPVNLVSYRNRSEETNCRCLSIRNGHKYAPPAKVPYLLEKYPTPAEIKDYLELAAQNGFGEGAIVTRRWAKEGGDHRWVQQWGTIIICHKVRSGGMAGWAPFAVKWHLLGEIEQVWAEDLYVIHAALDEQTLDSIVEAQDYE